MQYLNSNTSSLAAAAWCDSEVGSHHVQASLNNLLAVSSNIPATYVYRRFNAIVSQLKISLF